MPVSRSTPRSSTRTPHAGDSPKFRKKKKPVLEPGPIVKKKVRVTDDGPVVKKKLLALEGPKAKNPDRMLAKLNTRAEVLKKASTTFGLPSKQLYAMIQDGQMDQAIIVFQRQILATVLRLIPIAEGQYRKEKKEHTAYALNSLISQARELTTDIQASSDRGQVAETIVNDILMPTFRSFVETLVIESQTLKAAISSKVRPDARNDADLAIDSLVRAVARTGNELFRVNAGAIRDQLGAPKRGARK